jgi:putative Holliday junction resolvase
MSVEGQSDSPRPDDLPTTGRLLAIDIGDKRIGLALTDPLQTVANPLATLTRRPGRRFPLKRLKEHLDAHRPVGIVVGLPLLPDGSEGERAGEARATATRIANQAGLPVTLWDERMTTARALEAIRTLGGGLRGRKKEVDQLAATTLLQSFLDSRR